MSKKSTDNTIKDEDKNTDMAAKTESLSFYTGMSMIQVLISVATAVLGMFIWSRPVYYIIDTLYNRGYYEYYDFYETDSLDLFVQYYFDLKDNGLKVEKLVGLLTLIGAILLVVGALSQLAILIRAMSPVVKPLIVFNITGLVAALAAPILYFIAFLNVINYIDAHEYLSTLDKSPYFNLYIGCYAAMAVNIIGTIVNVVASVKGLKKWKKDGAAY